MKLMDRYIVREMMIPFLAGSIMIALLFDANQLIYIFKTFNVQNVPGSAIVQMLLYRTPHWLNFTLPAGVALASALAITRLSRESELVAFRAVGTPVIRVILPVAVFGLAVAALNWYIVEKVTPKAEKLAHRREVEVGVAAATPKFNSNVWLTLRQYRASFGEVSRVSDDELAVKNVVLGERPNGGQTSFTFADIATYKGGVWTLPNATVFILTPKGLKLTRMGAKTITINQPIFLNDLFETSQPEDKTAEELVDIIAKGKRAGQDMTKQEIDYHSRFAGPASCIVFALVSPIFAIMFARTGSFVGLLLSFVLVLLYYNAFVISTEVIGGNHWVSPFMAAWLPNFVFVGLGILGVRKLE